MSNYVYYLEKMGELVKDNTFQVEAAQIRARALFKEVTGEIPDYRWKYIVSRLVRNLIGINFGLEILSNEAPLVVDELQQEIKQFAILWESFSKLEEGIDGDIALLNAAMTYELAGYQANAAVLVKKMEKELFTNEVPEVDDLVSSFLQRYMIETNRMGEILERLENESESKASIIKKMSYVLTGKAFQSASKYFLTGKEKELDDAYDLLKKSEHLFDSYGAINESNLVRITSSLLKIMKIRSTWTILSEYVNENPRWTRYLKLLARGLKAPINESPSITELWPSQILALKEGLLASSSKIIKMPTSAGKTRIAEIAMVHTLISNSNSKCVYVAPFRALVSELEQNFIDIFGDLGYQVSSLRGAYDTDDLEEEIINDADLLVITPEKLDLVQRTKPEFLMNTKLFVIDECQLVKEIERGIKFELLLSRLKMNYPEAKFLLISAVIPQETLVDFANWFNVNPDKDVLSTTWRPSIQRIAKFSWYTDTIGTIEYKDTDELDILDEFITGIIVSKKYRYRDRESGRYKSPTFPKKENKGQVAAELAYKFADLGPVLVFCTTRKSVNGVGKWLAERIDIGINIGEKIPKALEYNESIHSVKKAKEWLGEDHLVTKLLKRGIAIHHGRIPEVVRNAIEQDFRDRHLSVIIATTTLAQGVNLPIKTIIIHSCYQHINKQNVPMSSIEYWNIAGRAGRAGKETEGTIIHIVHSYNDEIQLNNYIAKRRELEPIKSALYNLLVDLIEERLTESALSAQLDPEILPLLVEESSVLSEVEIQRLLDETLVQKQAFKDGVDLNRLKKVIEKTAMDIKTITSPELIPIFSSTGLSGSSCIKITNIINEKKDYYKKLLSNATHNDCEELLDVFLDVCEGISEMKMDDIDFYFKDILLKWLSGAHIEDIIDEFTDSEFKVEELVQFIETYFSYYLPWGITGFLKIAGSVLEIEDEMSIYCRFLPSMIKYGVPNPETSWAMSVGVPSRSVATKIALEYLKETIDISYTNFITWFGSFDPELLKYKFDFDAYILEDISKASMRSGINELLIECSNADDLLPIETLVKGIFVDSRESIALRNGVGSLVTLERDYYNELDRNAVHIMCNKEMIGYLDKYIAQVIAPDIDCGARIEGKITRITKGSGNSNSDVYVELFCVD